MSAMKPAPACAGSIVLGLFTEMDSELRRSIQPVFALFTVKFELKYKKNPGILKSS